MITDDELRFVEARFSVLIVPMPLDANRTAWVVIKCVTCGRRFWMHESSTANVHELGAISGHAKICDAELRYLSTREDAPF